MRHLADVTALRTDPAAQRQVLIDGLNQLLGTQLGVWLTMDDWRPSRVPRPVHQVLTSNPDPFWIRYMQDFIVHHQATDDPYADHSIRSPARTQLWKFDRLIDTRASQRRYGATLDVARKLKVCDGVVSVVRTGEHGDRVVGFSLQRRVEAGRLNGREIALASLAIHEIGGLIRRGSLACDDTARPTLPPRLAETLEQLLSGQSPSHMARAMGISLETVREHIHRLYRYFNVHSREELMAKFVK